MHCGGKSTRLRENSLALRKTRSKWEEESHCEDHPRSHGQHLMQETP